MIEVLDAAAVDLAAMIRRRELTPLELVDAHIARIESVNPHINAVVAHRFEAARREAVQAAATLTQRSADVPPFLGVPCTIKEFFSVQGLPHSAGLWSRRHVRATVDAEAVQRIRRAGAIVLGVTNVPEGGLWLETYNRIYGRTNNPWDTRRTSGGSSGGEAAIVASGGSPFGIASDLGGSIRIPAALCGVVGHKPTGRLVPNTGCWPEAQGELSAYLSTGPIARRVRDVMPLLRILAGPNGTDPVVQPMHLGDPATVAMKDLVVYPVEDTSGVYTWPAARQAVRQATAALAARGARIEQRTLPRLHDAYGIWAGTLAGLPGPRYADMLGLGLGLAYVRELIRLPLRRSRYTSVALILSALEKVIGHFPGRLDAFTQAGKRLQHELEATLGANGVLLHPPYSRPAPRHRAAMLTPLDFTFAGIFNVLEFPVTTVPIGFDRQHLPLGVQIAARRGNDHVTLAVAAALEEDFGGWVRAEPQPRRQAWYVGGPLQGFTDADRMATAE